MRVLVERDALLQALKHTVSVAERKSDVMILTHVLLDARGEELWISATDLDLYATDMRAARVSEPGQATVNASRLHEFVSALAPGGQVELAAETAPSRLEVSCGRSRCRLPTLPAEDFPRLDALPGGGADASLPAAGLRRLFEKVNHAICTIETKPALCGVCLHTVRHDGALFLRAVATDGFLLGWSDLPAPDGLANMEPVILPPRAVVEIVRLLADQLGDAQIKVAGKRVQVAVGAAAVASKVVDYEYPNYQRAVPLDHPHTVRFGRAALEQSLKRLRVAFEDRNADVKLSVATGRLGLRTQSQLATAFAEDEIEATLEGVHLEVGLGARRLQDTIGKMDCDQVEVRFKDHVAPLTFHDPKDPDTLLLVMPRLV
jgi:DNA polymerase III subunit beta